MKKLKVLTLFFTSVIMVNFNFAKSSDQMENTSSENTLRLALDHAALKYYGTPLVSAINNNAFKGKLTVLEKVKIEKGMLHPGTNEYNDLSTKLNSKYKLDDAAGTVNEIISRLYYTKDVQKEVIEKIFTMQNKTILNKYIELVRNEEINEIPKYILDKWQGRSNFISIAQKTNLFWPNMDELESSFVPIEINGKTAYSLRDYSYDAVPVMHSSYDNHAPEKYDSYYQASYTYYANANAALTSYKELPRIEVYPTFFVGLKDPGSFHENKDIDFSLIGTLAHEFGHGVAMFSTEVGSKKEFKKISNNEIAEIENKILKPFFKCYSTYKKEDEESNEFLKIQLQESRADAIAYITLKSLMTKLSISDESIFMAMLNRFKSDVSENLRDPQDPHPLRKDRTKIATGRCKMTVIPPYFVYGPDEDSGEIKIDFEGQI
ncbi:MAG: hypothetical protein PHY93_16215 [Bacteriovorax sp.]|nr:hypothetical protein [Bacteriovorax sp.]